MSRVLAPVVIFGYNRKEHLEALINSLKKDSYLADSDVFMFIDGPKNEQSKDKVIKVREYGESLRETIGSKSFTLTIRQENNGLAKSIIQGVSEIINSYGKVIVIEDDVVVAEDFLQYMNNALDYYQNDKKIWSVGGFSFINKFPERYEKDVFFTQRSSSYAWGTWESRWNQIDWSVQNYEKFRYSILNRASFNKWGEDRSMMLDSQMRHRLDSWAIRFDFAMWHNQMYNVVPVHSRCYTTGHDGTGTHPMKDKKDLFQTECIRLDKPIELCDLQINEEIRSEFTNHFKVPLIRRIKKFFLD